MSLKTVENIDITINSDRLERAHFALLKEMVNPSDFVSNVKTELKFIQIKNSVLPVTINDYAYDTSYVCSVYTAFVSYASTEVFKIKNKLVQKFVLFLINQLSWALKKAKIDKVVSHNNFLLSTNLYPKMDFNSEGAGIDKAYLANLLKSYPDYAIIFRSLNLHTNASLMEELKRLGFKLVPSRQVYFFDKNLQDYSKHHNYKMDAKLLKKHKDYQFCQNNEVTEKDYPRIIYLYNLLYIEKYSIYNPMFTEKYIEAAHRLGFIEFFGLRNAQGELDAILGCYDRLNVTTAPIVGYDTHKPAKLGLYRMLIAQAIQRAEHKGLILNLSSGASEFKRLRGGVPVMEYSALYTEHLTNRFQKVTWSVLRFILVTVAAPLMKWYKL